jgi:hypothetical protein
MPSPERILSNLTLMANEAVALAIAWHGLTLIAILALLLGWRPSRRVAGAALAAPIASAGTVAFLYGNPFNGVLLGALAVALVGLASRLGPERTTRDSAALTAIGVAMITFGWLYPHFLGAGLGVRYLISAPTGVVPCPTLSLVIGLALLAGGFGSRAWSLPLALIGLFYGLYGFARLGVDLDAALVGGSAALLAVAVRPRRRLPRAGARQEVGLIHVRRSAPVR